MKRVAWNEGAGDLLASTLDGYPREQLADDIRNGSCELWRFDDGSYCVLEATVPGITLYVWAIAGRDLRRHSLTIVELARRRGFAWIQYRTQHRGLYRLLRHLAPTLVRHIEASHCEWCIEVAS